MTSDDERGRPTESDPNPSLGMRVRRKTKHDRIAIGTGGRIDVVNDDGVSFWVATDCGGFNGWTSFDAWSPE